MPDEPVVNPTAEVNPLVVAEVVPFILVSPSIKVGTPIATAVDLKCSSRQISHGVEQDSNDYETFCGTYRAYGASHETLTITAYTSYAATGIWTVLYPMRNTVVDFSLLPDDRVAASPTNPQMTGKVRVPNIPFLDAALNEASEIEIELAIQGVPTYVVV